MPDKHSQAVALHPAGYIGSTDPVGSYAAVLRPHVFWFDTTGTYVLLKKRDAGNTTWAIFDLEVANALKLAGTTPSANGLSLIAAANYAAMRTLLSLGTAALKDAGAANGVAELDGTGKVPAAQLPSYVDDVLEYADFASLPGTGETGKIYVTLDTNKTYRWTGSVYVEISVSYGYDNVTIGVTGGNLYVKAGGISGTELASTLSGNKTWSGTQIFQKATVHTPVTLTDAATIATDASLGNRFRVTLGGNRTLGNPTNPSDGQQCIWEIKQDGTGSRLLTLDTKFRFGTDITGVTLTTTANKTDYLTAIYNSSADKWDVVGFLKGY